MEVSGKMEKKLKTLWEWKVTQRDVGYYQEPSFTGNETEAQEGYTTSSSLPSN